MRLIYILDYCFQQTPDGSVWTDTAYALGFWYRYLAVYSNVIVVCRVNRVEEALPDWRQVDGPGVQVVPVPNYRGPLGYLLKRWLIVSELDDAFARPGVVMLRVPSNLARCAAARLKKIGRPFGVDVVGDPWEALAPGVVSMKGRAFFRRIFTDSQRKLCSDAKAVAYVASTLAENYPAAPDHQVLVCSDVRLSRDWIRTASKVYERPAVNLMTVATLSQTYKGIHILLRALAICKKNNMRFNLSIVGTGKYLTSLKECAEGFGISGQVQFRGAIPWGAELRDALDEADIFVLPSLVEVMPRALLEAMARGLPSIATKVGAVSQLLVAEDIVQPDDAIELAERLMETSGDCDRLNRMSARNLSTAGLYAESVLLPRWTQFHRDLVFASAAK